MKNSTLGHGYLVHRHGKRFSRVAGTFKDFVVRAARYASREGYSVRAFDLAGLDFLAAVTARRSRG